MLLIFGRSSIDKSLLRLSIFFGISILLLIRGFKLSGKIISLGKSITAVVLSTCSNLIFFGASKTGGLITF